MKSLLLIPLIPLLLCGCKTTWLGPSEPLDAMMLRNNKSGQTNVVIYGFYHTSKDKGYIVWKTVPLQECCKPQ